MDGKPFILTCDTFGEWLRSIKEEHGYTYEYMAQKTGLSTFALQRYITRHLPPSLDSVEKVVEAFGRHIYIR